jgi:hypothetical protein
MASPMDSSSRIFTSVIATKTARGLLAIMWACRLPMCPAPTMAKWMISDDSDMLNGKNAQVLGQFAVVHKNPAKKVW